MRNIVILSGSSHPDLARAIASRLGLSLGRATLSHFSNQETSVEIGESVRDMDVYVIQSFHGSINNQLLELLIMLHACKIASANQVTAVLPFFPYSKQASGPYDKVPIPRSFPSLLGSTTSSSSNASTPPPPLLAPSSKYVPLSSLHSPTLSSPACLSLSRLSPSETPISSPTHPDPSSSFSSSSSLFHSRSVSSSGPPSSPRGSSSARPMRLTSSPADMIGTIMPSGYKTWRARSGKLVANLMMTAGADHIITMDLHDPQYQGFFDIPVDNLRAEPLLVKYVMDHVSDYKEKAIVVSPDAGGAKRAVQLAELLGIEFALIHKERRHHRLVMSPLTAYHSTSSTRTSPTAPNNEEKVTSGLPDRSRGAMSPSLSHLMLVGDVKGKVVLLMDDMADTCNTLIRAAHLCLAHGADQVYALLSHGIFSGDALDRLQASPICQVVCTASIPRAVEVLSKYPKIKLLDIAPLFAEAIRRIHYGESVSFLFDRVPLI